MRRIFTDEEMIKHRALADSIKDGAYVLPIEGQLLKPDGAERHSKVYGEHEDE